MQAGDIDFIIGKYRYTSTFTLFNYMTGFEPDSYNFLTIIPVNSAILRKNSFDLSDETIEKLTDIYYNGYKTDMEGAEEPEEGEKEGETGEEEDSDTKEEGPDIDVIEPEIDKTGAESAEVKNKLDIQMPEVSLQ